VELHLTAPEDRVVAMRPTGMGYFETTVDGVRPGTRYLYRLDGGDERPDPASRSQPTTVHEPSEVIDPSHPWADEHWYGLPLDRYIVYEMHVGTFTPEGTFDAIIPRLAKLIDLGLTVAPTAAVAYAFRVAPPTHR
jgi:maltooligosyltrehalose trehalohydrolase